MPRNQSKQRERLTPKTLILWGQAVAVALPPAVAIAIAVFIYITGRKIEAGDISLITVLLAAGGAGHGILRFIDGREEERRRGNEDNNPQPPAIEARQRPSQSAVKRRGPNLRAIFR